MPNKQDKPLDDTKPIKVEPKLHAYVIAKPFGAKDWSMVVQTEYFDDGTWVSGMNLITSIDDVLDRAEKKGIIVVFESMLGDKL